MFVLALIGVPILELFVFIEVGRTIGWLPAFVLLIGTSLFGIQTMRIEGRAAFARVSLAMSERHAPARAAIDSALGFLGALLLVIPGFVTDAIGVVLLLPASRATRTSLDLPPLRRAHDRLRHSDGAVCARRPACGWI